MLRAYICEVVTIQVSTCMTKSLWDTLTLDRMMNGDSGWWTMYTTLLAASLWACVPSSMPRRIHQASLCFLTHRSWVKILTIILSLSALSTQCYARVGVGQNYLPFKTTWFNIIRSLLLTWSVPACCNPWHCTPNARTHNACLVEFCYPAWPAIRHHGIRCVHQGSRTCRIWIAIV